MRKGKSVFLLVLFLCMAIFLVACGSDTGEDGTDTDSAATDTVETEPVEEEPQEEPVHEITRYFVLEREKTAYDCSKVTRYEGEPVDLDQEHHLLAIKTQETDTANQKTDTVTVYDLLTGETILTQSVTNPVSAEGEKTVALSVTLDYPVIRVERKSVSEDGKDTYDVSYYLAKKDSEPIRTTQKKDYKRSDYGNGLSAFRMGDETVWIDRRMQEIRSVNAIAAGGYDAELFKNEYQGYLYTWNEKQVQVFNRLGVCSGLYSMSDEGYLNVHVLNNGNVLIQELKFVDVHTSMDFLWKGNRVRLTSYIMNCSDGNLSAVPLNFVVETLQTAYAERYGAEEEAKLPFRLAAGQENQAIIYRFVNGGLSLYQEYVVLTNDLRVLYTLNNMTEGLDLRHAYPLSETLYVAEVWEGGDTQAYIFDLEGNRIAPMSAMDLCVTERYLVTPNGVYDHRMNLLYDLTVGEFAGGLLAVDEATDQIYLSKHNFISGGDECYLLDVENKQVSLICDGKGQSFQAAGEGYYVLKNEANGQISYVGIDGETKLVVYRLKEFYRFAEALAVVCDFKGSNVTYVIG